MERTVKVLSVTLMVTFATVFSSCEDCQDCEKVGGDETREFCEEEIDLAEKSDNWDC